MNQETSKPAPADGAAEDRRQFMDRDKDAPAPGEERRFKAKRRRKVSYLTINKIDYVDYKEVNILRRFINDRGKILPSRQTGNTAKQQRMIAAAIRKAREMALLPFVVGEVPIGREFTRRERPPRDNAPQRESAPQQQAQPEEAAPAPAPADQAEEAAE